mgnify:CR=1 FL=1
MENNLHDYAFEQWLKSRYLKKKHVFEGEEIREKDYAQNSIKVENTQNLHFDIDNVNSEYNAQVGGFKQELDTLYYHNPSSFSHSTSLTLQGIPNSKTWEAIKFLAIENEKDPGYYFHLTIELLGQYGSDSPWYDTHRLRRKAIGVARVWKSELKDYDKNLINFYACIEVPEYAVRLNNMTLDERIKASITSEKINKISNSFEDSEEINIFQLWLHNNRSTYENKINKIGNIVKDKLTQE